MRKLLSALLVLLWLLAPAAMAESQDADVAGFWYTEQEGDSIDLLDTGEALLRDEGGEIIAQGTYEVDGSNVTVNVGGDTIEGVVSGDSMVLNGGETIYEREREIKYWINTQDNTALELDAGHVWSYDEDAELVAEGSYTMEGNGIHIQLNGKTMVGTIDGDTMMLDDVEYSLL